MITIERHTSLLRISGFVPYCTFESPAERDAFMPGLTELFKQRPDSVLVVAAYDGGKLLGFIMAQDTDDDTVWIIQAWSRQDSPWAVIDNLWARVILWSLSLGRSRIRASTLRNVEALSRRFKFHEVSRTIEHTIDQAMFTPVLDVIKENLYGKPVQDTESLKSEYPLSRTTKPTGPSVGVHPRPARGDRSKSRLLEDLATEIDEPGRSGDVGEDVS